MNASRRRVIAAGIFLLAVGWGCASVGAVDVVTIHMRQSPDGAQVYFDPIGVHIQPGQIVRWIQLSNYHSVTAYHPANGPYDNRLPPKAAPWDSGVLTEIFPAEGAIFEHRFIEEGVYDYFCRPHEASGMVGRIVVGSPVKRSESETMEPLPATLPSVKLILSKGIVRLNSDGYKTTE